MALTPFKRGETQRAGTVLAYDPSSEIDFKVGGTRAEIRARPKNQSVLNSSLQIPRGAGSLLAYHLP